MRDWFAKRRMITGALGLLLVAAIGVWVYLDFSGDVVPGVQEAEGMHAEFLIDKGGQPKLY